MQSGGMTPTKGSERIHGLVESWVFVHFLPQGQYTGLMTS